MNLSLHFDISTFSEEEVLFQNGIAKKKQLLIIAGIVTDTTEFALFKRINSKMHRFYLIYNKINEWKR